MPAWLLGMLLIVMLLSSGAAHALVCQQRGERPSSESARVFVGELPLKHHEDQRGSVVWHIHIEVPIECTWSDEKGGELAAEQQSSEALRVYIDPSWQDSALAGMRWDISVDRGRSIYRVGRQMMVLESNQHMPCFLIMRICDHRDELGCRHWRNAPSQDYRMQVATVLPIDVYFQAPFLRKPYLAHLLLQVGNGQVRPDIRSRLNVPVHLPSLAEGSVPLMKRLTANSVQTPRVPMRPSLNQRVLSLTSCSDYL